MNKKRTLGIFLIAIGLILILNSQVSILGAVIGVGAIISTTSLILGLVFVIVGVILFASARKRESALEKSLSQESSAEGLSRKQYFKKRVDELTKNSRDSWIGQWELKEVTNDLEDEGYDTRGPEIDVGGYESGPSIRHIKVEGYNKNNVYIRKHLLISQDPEDKRIKRSDLYRRNQKLVRKYK